MTTGVDLVNGERQSDYGTPKESMNRIAQVWSGILGKEIYPHQVALCMAGLKLAREGFKHKEDNLTDCDGYIEILRRLNGKENK